ncbi:MAG: ferric reductase-like transmembrane domain-containing protein [Patescibacteria group bacterium]
MKIFWQKNSGGIIILVLSLLPALEWLRLAPLNTRFYNLSATMTSLGQVAGLVGLALFSVNLVLTGRLKIFDRLFFGLNNAYNYHRQIGAIGFSLLLFHPLLLAVAYLQISTLAAARFLLPFYDAAITYGIISLLMMILFLGLTFYGSLKYHHWKITHKLMLVAFIFGLLHVLSITSDVSRDPFLKTYLIALGLLGLGVGAYRAVLSYFWHRNFSYKIQRLNRLSAGITEIELAPIGRALDFLSGQFVFVRFFSRHIQSESHPFSISSAPSPSQISLAIKSLGDFTDRVKDLEPGDTVSLEGPFGKFSYRNGRHKKQIWIAGGIGITPFLSMARSLTDDRYQIDLYYCVRQPGEAVFLPELENIAQKNSALHLIPWYSQTSGYLTGQAVEEKSAGLRDKDIFICGPDNLMSALKAQLRDQGVAASDIYSEEFKFL